MIYRLLPLPLFFILLLFPPQIVGSTIEPYVQTRLMLHTTVEIKAYGENVASAVEDALSEMERVNRLLNNYDPSSEVSRINNAAGSKAVAISPETTEALSGARHYGDLTGGALDITIGPLLKLWGFTKEEPGISSDLPSAHSLGQAKDLVDYRLIHLDTTTHTAMLTKKGMWIDAGSFTKGYVADRAALVLKKQGISQALISAGGTILAVGKKPDGASWQVGVRHPRKADKLLDAIPLENQAVSTSGDYERFYQHGGRRINHIIDPRSGRPVDAVQSISVIAPTGMASDALSTALFVLGTQKSLSLVKDLPGVEIMIIDQEGKEYLSPGWPSPAKER
jgi:thiamine biosynthesis lipoprotein